MMKKGFTISLNIVLLLFFTVTSQNALWACDKGKAEKETRHKTAKCQKSCCVKNHRGTDINCKSVCCEKNKTKTEHQKKGCCGDGDCSCSVSTTVLADLPKLYLFDFSKIPPVFIVKNTFFYKQVFTKSSINSIWQPPISDLSI